MRFVVYVETASDGSAMAHVPALPGCFTAGLNEDVALGRLPQAITDYYAWLKYHNEPVPDPIEPIELEVAEVTASGGEPGDAEAFFQADGTPLTAADLAAMLRLMTYSRQDLIHLFSGLTGEILNWKPGRDNNGQEVWDISDILDHIASAERFYASRLNTDTKAMLQDARNAVVERLSTLDDNGLEAVAEHAGEQWSARKVVRRVMEHEREHMGHIAQVLERLRASQGLHE